MIIRRPEKSTHWYLKNGDPLYEVPKLDGSGMRPATVRDAFKNGAYRSVTNVLSVLDKPGLDAWKSEQIILAALTLPQREGEDLHAYAERVLVDSEAQMHKAAEAGTRLHELMALWLVTGEVPAPESEACLIRPFQDWCNANLHPDQSLVATPESVMLNHQHGYAGRIDLPVRFKDGSIGILDAKTQDVKRNGKGEAKPAFYDFWPLQLAAYSRCIFADGNYPPVVPWRLFSLVIDRSQPGCYEHEWTDKNNVIVSSEPYFQAFLAACRLWSHLKGGTPGIDVKRAA